MPEWEERYYEREEGKEEGKAELLKEYVIKMNRKGMCTEKIADILEEDVEKIHNILNNAGI